MPKDKKSGDMDDSDDKKSKTDNETEDKETNKMKKESVDNDATSFSLTKEELDAFREEYDETKIFDNLKIEEATSKLLKEDDGLSVEFKKELNVIIESLVKQQVKEIYLGLEEAKIKQINESLNFVEKMLLEKVEDTLNYQTEVFVKNNKQILESTFKIELAENLFESIKTLLTENHIDVPQEKIEHTNLLESKYDKLLSEYNSIVEDNEKYVKENIELSKQKIIEESLKDVTELEKGDIISLVENINFKGLEDFKTNVVMFKDKIIKNKDKTASLDNSNSNKNLNENIEETKIIQNPRKESNSFEDVMKSRFSKIINNK